MADRLRILVGYPSPDDRINPRFSECLLNLLIQNFQHYDLTACNATGSRIVLNRNTIVQEARKFRATHILWIDSDTSFPVDGLRRLIEHDKEIVCATTSRRIGENRAPAAYPMDISAIQPFQKLVPMKFIGFPFMLTKMSVFDKIKRPYFAEPPRRLLGVFEGKEYLSAEEMYHDVMPEDEYFCWQCREAGMDIWCDMNLTMEIGHIGLTTYYVKNPLPEGKKEGEITFEKVVAK